MDGDQARHPGALLELGADQVARPLGGDQDHVQIRPGEDPLEMDVKPMGKKEGRPFFEMGFIRGWNAACACPFQNCSVYSQAKG